MIATVRPINIGILASVATFGLSTLVLGETVDEALAGFPADLFVVLVGITYLFSIAQANGTVSWFLHSTTRLTKDRAAFIPWGIFVLGWALCAIGAVGPAISAILMPIAMSFAAAHGIRPLMMGIMLSVGATAGSFSPTGLLGVIVRGAVQDNTLPFSAGLLFAYTSIASVLLGAVVFVVLGGLKLPARRAVAISSVPKREGPGAATSPTATFARGGTTNTRDDDPTSPDGRPRLNTERSLTVIGFILLIVGSLVFGLDVGFVALAVAAVLSLLYSDTGRNALGHVSWSVVLLITGVVTLVGFMERTGTVTWLGDTVTSISQPLLASLLVCVIAAVVSAFASTTAILGALIPLAVPLMSSGEVGPIALVVALSISSTVVDISPFSTNGSLILANGPEAEREYLYRALLKFGLVMIVEGPLLSWGVFILPGAF